jgi:glycosyltransferase involved in cell wall biosynthesis
VLPVVPARPKRIDDYAEAAGRDAGERVRRAAQPLRGSRLLQVSSTAFGGGVAELLHTHVSLLNAVVGGIRLQIHDGVTGYLVHDTLACAEAITQLLSEPNLRDRMGEAGRNIVRERFLSTREIADHLKPLARLR